MRRIHNERARPMRRWTSMRPGGVHPIPMDLSRAFRMQRLCERRLDLSMGSPVSPSKLPLPAEGSSSVPLHLCVAAVRSLVAGIVPRRSSGHSTARAASVRNPPQPGSYICRGIRSLAKVVM
ncbi:hypothetical protein Taro_011450 [Colocasia esculenta]|uniref:Uncharacterized protein n=1 Tax=Colocasia esculenta TaxID=4460 RepID=A0A843UAN7_COLES|nr:hypothetical protein [Colocasia esculenta]